MTTYNTTRAALTAHKLAPHKKLGQNFLVHRQTAEAIVRAGMIAKTDCVVEVGVGLGALTLPLAATAKQVIGLEVDSGIIRMHATENDLPDNVSLRHQDVLTADFAGLAAECQGRLKIIANLPYSISNPFIFKLIENRQLIDSVTVMLQKEVAERLMANPASKEYGIPTVLLRSCATVKKLMTLKPAEFHPRPKIDSVVIRIQFRTMAATEYLADPGNFSLLQKIVRSSFSQRRKTLLNTLGGSGLFKTGEEQDKAAIKIRTEAALKEAGIDPSLRPEVLHIEDFIRLSEAFARQLRQAD